MFRYFTTVTTEEEFNKLCKSPFIKVGNIVLYNDDAYVLNSEKKLVKFSEHEFMDKVQFFHRLNIGDKVQLKEPNIECEVIDFHYHFLSKESYYVMKTNDGKAFKVRVPEIDIQVDECSTPLSLFELED